MRLDRFLAHAGLGTRKEVKDLLKSKVVEIDGKIITSPAFQVDEIEMTITVNHQKIDYQEFHYFLLNKPKGYLSATVDAFTPTVLDLIHEPYRNLSPCGRLDKDTTGLMLILDNGKLSHFLLSPVSHVEKEYLVTVNHPLKKELPELFLKGITLDDGYQCLPSQLTIINETQAHVILKEGKYHQIKRMFEALGYYVIDLHRERMDTLTLGDLKEGEYRSLTDEEIEALLKHMR